MPPDKEWRDKVDASLTRIEKAIVGDPEIGLSGIVPRLSKAERWIRKADLRMAAVGGGAVVIAWLVEHFLFPK